MLIKNKQIFKRGHQVLGRHPGGRGQFECGMVVKENHFRKVFDTQKRFHYYYLSCHAGI